MKAQQLRKFAPQWRSRSRRSGWVLTGAIIAALGSLTCWFISSNNSSRHAGQGGAPDCNACPSSAQAAHEAPLAEPSHQDKPSRPVYAYSLVPGGIRNVAELRSAMVKDSVIFAQYSTFRLERARVFRLDHERRVHVAYRIGDRVYWTRREVKLEKGETLITDGVQTARTKCGNLVGEDVEGRVSPSEPTEQALNTPVEPMQAPNELESDNRFPGLDPPPSANPSPRPYDSPPSSNPWIGMGPGPGGPGSVFILPPPIPIPIGSGSGSPPPGPPNRPPTVPPTPPVPPVPPVINTPEPGTAAQFLMALPVILFLRRRWKTTQA